MKAKILGSLIYHTPKGAGVTSIEFIGHGQYILTFKGGSRELHVGHKFPDLSGYGIKYKNLILEFARSL